MTGRPKLPNGFDRRSVTHPEMGRKQSAQLLKLILAFRAQVNSRERLSPPFSYLPMLQSDAVAVRPNRPIITNEALNGRYVPSLPGQEITGRGRWIRINPNFVRGGPMKKLFTILIGASLAFTAAMAQQDNPEATPTKKKKQQQQQQQEQQQKQAQPGEQQGQPQQGRMQQRRQQRQERRMQQNQPGAAEGAQRGQRRGGGNRNRQEQQANPQAPNDRNADQNAGNAAEQQQRKNRQQANQREKSTETTTGSAATETKTNENTAVQGTNNQRRTAKAKPDTQKVQQIKQKNTNFHAQAKPQQVKSVTYQQNYRIANAEHWQGPQYVAFRTYRPAWHDQSWWHAHFPTIVLIGGGYYYWNAGFWYPAWGYNPSASYYAYDGPIYTGSQSLPPDQMIANVQSVLQDMGYYKGDVDGLLGPLTRDALTQYQADYGLYETAAIDQPTLDSLGLAG